MVKPKRQVRRKKKPARRKGMPKPDTSVLSRIISLEDMPEDGIKLCLYGRSATGKTRILGSFAKRGKLLHIICSGNKFNEARSIKGIKNIEIVDLQHPEELPELVEYARTGGFTTVGLDHVSEFSDLVLADVLGITKVPQQLSWGLATQQQYGQQSLQIKTYLRELLDLDCNVIINGQERVYQMQDEADQIVLPYVSVAASPAVASWITRTCDYVAHTFIRTRYEEVKKKVGKKMITKSVRTDEKEFCLGVGPDDIYTTKFRVPPGTELPDVIVEPTADNILELIG